MSSIHIEERVKIFCEKKYIYNTRRVKPLRENQLSETKIKNFFILYWLSVDEAFYLFFIFGDEKKIPEFFTAIFGPKLHVIIINDY